MRLRFALVLAATARSRRRKRRAAAPEGISARARALAERHLRLWTDPALKAEELRKMRLSNAEWDFMGRTFLVLAPAASG